jgi:hypothetical protein
MGIFLQDNTTPSGTNRNVNSVIQNNIVYGFGNAPLIWIQSQLALSGVSLSNNVYFSAYATPFSIGYDSVQYVNFASWLSMTGVDAQSLFQNPSLVNVTAFQAPGTAPYDFANANLSSVSAARGMGKTQSVFNNNLPGAVRSVWNGGAF